METPAATGWSESCINGREKMSSSCHKAKRHNQHRPRDRKWRVIKYRLSHPTGETCEQTKPRPAVRRDLDLRAVLNPEMERSLAMNTMAPFKRPRVLSVQPRVKISTQPERRHWELLTGKGP